MEWHVRRDNIIEHHGIDGMHWGERNGPPYPLSREKHNKVVRSAKEEENILGDAKVGTRIKRGLFKYNGRIMNAKDSLGYFNQEYVDLAEREAFDENKYNLDFLKKIDGSKAANSRETMLLEYQRFLRSGDHYRTPEERGWSYDPEEIETRKAADKKVRDMSKEFLSEREMMDLKTQRSNDAAVTGLNAMKKVGYRTDVDPNNRFDREWFMQEDQTFGLPQMADLANKGYSEKKIRNLINDAISAYEKSSWEKLYPYDEEGVDTSGIWYLNEGRGVDSEFIRACVEYNKH